MDYERLVQEGRLYDELQDRLESHGIVMPREVLKRKFLCDVLAKKKASRRGAEYPSPVEDAFREVFPTVYRFVREFNRDGWEHANLIRELQRQESQFVIEMVAADLMARHPTMFIITLHDAIYVREVDLPKVVEAFKRAFERIGF